MSFLCIHHRAAEQAVFNFVISSNDTNWSALAEIGYTPTIPLVVNVTVNAGILVRATVTTTPAMDFSGLPSGTVINLVNNGNIQGRGGNGGTGGNVTSGSNGAAGGNAIKAPGSGRTFNVTNASGSIWGGGGGGGGGAACALWNNVDLAYDSTGGGGGGGGGAGGGGGGGAGSGTEGSGSVGTAGTTGAGGGEGSGGAGFHAQSGDGGDGGDWGTTASGGENGSRHGGGPGGTQGTGGSGGAGGKAVDLNSGSINWISGSGSPNVKGAVV